MFFNSYIFLLLFLPLSVLGYWLIARTNRSRQIWLLIASSIFYVYASLFAFMLLVTMVVVTYLSARFLMSKTYRRLGLAVGLSNIGVLAFFKYINLLAHGANASGGTQSILQIALPLGISFYTFNLVSYILDVYRGQIPAAKSFIQFASYVAFFPTIISGPLQRYANFSQQQDAIQRLDPSNIELGIFSLIIGLAKKVIIADYLATIVDPLFNQYNQLHFVGAWIAALAFTYQLYFDFSGYTDMAVGVGYLLGFKLPQNFDAPYSSRSITEFWQRWHISLSHWFRDYVFIPLSRAWLKKDKGHHPGRIRTFSLIIMMMLVGLWHGASWTFVVWGLYYGILLAIHAQIRQPQGKTWKIFVGRAVSFGLIVIGWVIFRSTSLQTAGSIFVAMLGLKGIGVADTVLLGNVNRILLVVELAILFALTNLGRDTWKLQPRRNWLYATGLTFLFLVSMLMLVQVNPFLYFQF